MSPLGKQLVQQRGQHRGGAKATSRSGRTQEDNQIQPGQRMLAQSKLFAGAAFDGTTVHGPLRVTTPDHQSQTSEWLIVTTGENQKMAIGDPEIGCVENSAKLVTVKKTVSAREGKRSGLGKR